MLIISKNSTLRNSRYIFLGRWFARVFRVFEVFGVELTFCFALQFRRLAYLPLLSELPLNVALNGARAFIAHVRPFVEYATAPASCTLRRKSIHPLALRYFYLPCHHISEKLHGWEVFGGLGAELGGGIG
jgi:hypothetical protein